MLTQSAASSSIGQSEYSLQAINVDSAEAEDYVNSSGITARFQKVPKKPKVEMPPCHITSQLMEMGFARSKAETALKKLRTQCRDGREPTIESLVSYLLEHEAEGVSESSSDSDSYSYPDSDDEAAAGINYSTIRGSDSCESVDDASLSLAQQLQYFGDETAEPVPMSSGYRLRSTFTNMDEYARYVGMTVMCCEAYEEIDKGDIGRIVKIDSDGLHDLNVLAMWQRMGSTYWLRFVHVELRNDLAHASDVDFGPRRIIRVGDRVRVRLSVSLPRDAIIDFPSHAHWTGLLSELEVVPTTHTNIQCEGCGTHPIVGHRYKCQVCVDYNYCERCFTSRRHRSHPFFKFTVCGVAPVYAGLSGCTNVVSTMPPPPRRNTAGPPGTVVSDWNKCVKNLSVSSRERQAARLYDKSLDGCWQSSGRQGEHWIRVEMRRDICIARLSITVDPQDGSYMPTKVKVSAGDSLTADVVLLQDIKDYHKCIEVAITQCKNSGIDCKIHSLTLQGRVYDVDFETASVAYSFLASDSDESNEEVNCVSASSKSTTKRNTTAQKNIYTHVFCWGLNDKEQLGGPKGSKIKIPVLNDTLSRLKCTQIAGGSKSLYCVTQDGKVYACGEATNGRLGLGISSGTVSLPTQLTALSQYVVKKVAVHSGGRHALALTVDGKVFAWGEGDDGKLGHYSRATCDTPRLIECLRSKRVRDIACGSAHSACITSNGELYTWGLGEYGRLGHKDNLTQLRPKQVKALAGKRVMQVACGSRDAQTLALTEDGLVYSWGDGDFGKLGRGGSEGCMEPHVVDRLKGMGVCQIECGAQFSLALTKSGEVWTWLGHGADSHVRKPQIVEVSSLEDCSYCVGALHCLAVTSNGEVYAWGDNDHGQQGNGTTNVNKKPVLVQGLDGYHITKVACGSSHSVAWATTDVFSPIAHEPVLFPVAKDPLGASQLGLIEKGDNSHTVTNVAPSTNHNKPSLAKVILSLQQFEHKEKALQHVLRSLCITFARESLVNAMRLENERTTMDSSHCETSVGISTPASISPMMSPTVLTPRSSCTAPDVSCKDDTEVSLSDIKLLKVEEVADPPAVTMTSTPTQLEHSHEIANLEINADLVAAAPVLDTIRVMSPTAPTLIDLNEFTAKMSADDARMLVDLLKLAIANRADKEGYGTQSVSGVLCALTKAHPQVADMLMELYITDLEDIAAVAECEQLIPKPVVVESPHPYADESFTSGKVKIPGAECLKVEFDKACSTERNHDPLIILDFQGRHMTTRSGRDWCEWSQEVIVPGDQLEWRFTSDGSVNGWGWKFTVSPVMPEHVSTSTYSDRTILSKPSIDLVMSLLDLDFMLTAASDIMMPRLAASLAMCAQLSSIPSQQRLWALNKLRHIISSPSTDSRFTKSNSAESEDGGEGEYRSVELSSLIKGLPETILQQYRYEEPLIRSCKQLGHSPFFQVMVALACDLELDFAPEMGDKKWDWLRQYCLASRVAYSIFDRKPFPLQFLKEVRQSISEIDSSPLRDFQYEDNSVFRLELDTQLVHWLNKRPDDWVLAWGGSCQIFGWGHNHRGQLGGIEGAKVRMPAACESLAGLKPIQIAGGEQTLFIVTGDGKVYATGYGAGGRLGVGGTDSVAIPTLVDRLRATVSNRSQ
ncbi:HERC2 [Bugula neritina]|uniref:HERC2 n=1 Tax=Bugula neritina TaxID=10212 RepID=A0A7J7KH96_BUGNE|nr:HERC2 [Bugula neritina]